ncbi:MAG TPA: TOMM precursor leader peptide-binding protein [Steroidobacteraceae bacterium]|nr:TOMM precursor leader peptide-binding protein [Steroidobacteraceae bacterium]
MSDTGPIGIPCSRDMAEQMARLIDVLVQSAADPVGGDPLARVAAADRLSMQALLDLLVSAGVVHRPGITAIAGRRSLSQAHVVIVGAAPWAMIAGLDLAIDGLGALTVCVDARTGSAAEALIDRIRQAAPACVAAIVRDPAPSRATLVSMLTGAAALMIGGWAPARLDLQSAAERACRDASVPFLGAELFGNRAAIGPIALPGHAGCWLCAKLRLLATARAPWAAHRYARLCFEGRGPNPPAEHIDLARRVGRTVATEVASFLEDNGESMLCGRVLVREGSSSTGTLHRFLPMPWCDVCGGAPAASAQDDTLLSGCAALTADSPEQLLSSLAPLVDVETGVVRGIILRDRSNAEPAVPFIAVALTAEYAEPGERWPSEPASGKGMTPVEATIGALGEAVERYAASRYAPDALTAKRIDDLDGDVIDPRDLCLYGRTQYEASDFPFRPFDPAGVHHWVRGRWLDTGAAVWIAAAQVFYRFRDDFDDFFCQVTTNGLAAGTCVASATERAVLELIERDAVMLTWYCREQGLRLLPDDTDDDLARLIAELTRCGAEVELYLLDGAGGIPVVLCLALGDGDEWPGVTATSAAAYDARSAVRKALLEQGMTGAGLRRMLRDGSGPRPRRPEEVRSGSFLDHAAYYLPHRPGAGDFLRTPLSDGVPLSSLDSRYRLPAAELPDRLREAGIRVAAIDLTPPDLALGPFRVVRAAAPGLQALHCGFGMERLASPRLQQRLRGPINREPHPFC